MKSLFYYGFFVGNQKPQEKLWDFQLGYCIMISRGQGATYAGQTK